MQPEEIIEALKKSGYLLESETSKSLTQMGFFVETNLTIRDPITNKSREIDLVAEYFSRGEKKLGTRCAAKIKYVLEIKNNIIPLVLLTEYQFSPNSLFEEAFKIAQTIPKDVTYDNSVDFTEHLFPVGVKTPLFTQYCSFQKKKGNNEFMATHPDELHEGLSKITQYIEEELVKWDDRFNEAGEYYRNFIYLPVVLLNDDLYELYINEENSPILKNVGVARLMYNYHHSDEPKSSIVYFVTKAALPFFLDDMNKLQDLIEKKMIKLRKGGN